MQNKRATLNAEIMQEQSIFVKKPDMNNAKFTFQTLFLAGKNMLNFPLDSPSYEDEWMTGLDRRRNGTGGRQDDPFRKQELTRHQTYDENRRIHRNQFEYLSSDTHEVLFVEQAAQVFADHKAEEKENIYRRSIKKSALIFESSNFLANSE